MDTQGIFTAIGSLGFPIVACIAMFMMYIKSEERHKDETDKLSDAVNKMSNAVDNNTSTIAQMLESIKILLGR